MYFGTFLDREGQWLDTVHFPPIAQAFPFKGRGIYQITGLITEEFECINVEVQTMVRLAIIEDPRYSEARTTTKRQLDPTMPNRPRGQKARKEIS
jgi:DNA polymerase-3 subunit alpha